MNSIDVVLSKTPNTPEFNNISKDIEECERIAAGLARDLSKVDASIADLTGNFFSVAESCFGFTESITNGINEKNIEKNKGRAIVGMAAGAAGLVASAAGLVVGATKHIKAKIEYNKKMNALLEEKQVIAEEKLGDTMKYLDKMRKGVFLRMEQLYSKEFNKTVECDDELLAAKLNVFKKAFGMFLKTKVLDSSLEYLVCEMKAWQNGKHDSQYKIKSPTQLFKEEIMTWPKIFKADNWTVLMNKVVNSSSNTINLPIAFILNEPVMLQTFGKMEFPLIDNIKNEEDIKFPPIFKCNYIEKQRNNGRIHYSGSFVIPETPVNQIIKNNEYYIKSHQCFNSKYDFPVPPKGFGLWDALILGVSVIALVSYYLFISNWLCDNGFFRWLLYLLPYFIIYGRYLYEEYIDIEDVFTGLYECIPSFIDFYASILPYNIRKKRYKNEVQEIIDNISNNVSHLIVNRIVL